MKIFYAAFIGLMLTCFWSLTATAQSNQGIGASDSSLVRKEPAKSNGTKNYYTRVNKVLFAGRPSLNQLVEQSLKFQQPYVKWTFRRPFTVSDIVYRKPSGDQMYTPEKQIKKELNSLLASKTSLLKTNSPVGSALSSQVPGANLPQTAIPGLAGSNTSAQPVTSVPGQSSITQMAPSSVTSLLKPTGTSPLNATGTSSVVGTANPLNNNLISSIGANSLVNTNALTPPANLNAQSAQTTANSLIQVPSPLKSGVPAIPSQSVTGIPTQFFSGVTGSKDEMNKMAALRSQLLVNPVGKGMSNPAFASTLTLENDLLYQPVLGVVAGNKFEDVVGVKGSLIAFGIPLNVNFSNNQAAFNGTSPINNSLFKFGFSPSMFSGLMKSDIQQYDNLKNTAFGGFNFTEYVHQTLNQKVSTLESDQTHMKNSIYADDLDDGSKLQGLIKLSDTQLKEKLDAEADQKYDQDLKAPGADPVAAQTAHQQNYNRADSIEAVIGSIKGSLLKNGLDPNKLLLAENYSTGRTSPAFNSSETANNMNSKEPSNSFMSMLSNVKDFRFGSFGTQVPGETGQDTKLMNGANLTVRVGYYPLTVGFGTLNDINSLKDDQFQSSVYAAPKTITYVGTEINRGGGTGDVKIAVVSSFSGQSNNVQYSAPTLPGNAVAITATKAVKVDDFGNITVDVSKSGTLFSSNYIPGAESVLTAKAAGANSLNTNLFESFAAGFTHSLNITSLNASDNVYFNYAGLGYQNPANNGYSGATIKYGGILKKKLYKNKLTLDFRTDVRSMPLSYVTNDTWKNYQIQFDSKYQITKKFNVSFKYIDASTTQNMDGVSSSIYSSSKFELTGNDSYKIGKYFTTSQLSISTQSLTNVDASASSSSLVNVNYAQSVLLKNSSITATIFYNKELSAYQLIGDLLTTDLTYQYKLFKNLQSASGLTYLNNTGIAQQAGIRQSLQFMAGKHFDINASVDLRKNLITPQYADLYSSTRGELSLKYYFKID
ncbi:hypothetical protein HDF24_13930 [Mucilaginibacter sp. X4EP1]|uniref:hypothetical protein n=1 Tax=Mucilaginibacter sp. X4EP1 TaxID=2723092 RepID=UPI0021690BE0|nr:hypothetical protein [Mucilaginibacter sp. X4EP1]MCS3814663.1 hypothetical protein [Mucilaginibacter sp. X4EP1]